MGRKASRPKSIGYGSGVAEQSAPQTNLLEVQKMQCVENTAGKFPSKAKLTFCITMIVLAILTVTATKAQAETFIGSQEASGSMYNYPGTKAMGMVVDITELVSINEMYAHVYNVGSSTRIRGIIYQETTAGDDWNVVAYTDALGIAEGWNQLSFPYTVELTTGKYLLAHITDGTRILYYTGINGGRVWNGDVVFENPDSPQPVQLAYHYGAWAPVLGEETPAEPELESTPVEPFRAQYLFNGNADDTGGKGYHGQAFNVALVADRFGNPENAYEFNGVDSFVEIPFGETLSLLTDYTISVWVYPYKDGVDSRQSPIIWKLVNEGGNDDIYGIGYGFGYGTGADNQPRFTVGTEVLGADYVAASDIYPSGEWYNIQATRIGSEMIIEVYDINGNLMSRNIINVTGTPMRGPAPLRIGNLLNSDHGGYGCYDCAGVFQGVIDDIEFYNSALSEEARATLALVGVTEEPPVEASAIESLNNIPAKSL
jgi:concanavalin A-like lectin/glucanase superfamily protein